MEQEGSHLLEMLSPARGEETEWTTTRRSLGLAKQDTPPAMEQEDSCLPEMLSLARGEETDWPSWTHLPVNK